MPRSRQPVEDGEPPRSEKPQGALARFTAARKVGTLDLLVDIERQLQWEATQPQEQNGSIRSDEVIHPSEIAHSDWCPLSTYLRIRWARDGKEIPRVVHAFQTENIFEEGHEYHRKWQGRIRRMGRLRGRWGCRNCKHRWMDVSPEVCPECGSRAVDYFEVPLSDPAVLIYGHADGDVLVPDPEVAEDAVLIEIKSVGEGTVRMELPQVFARNHYEITNLYGKKQKILDTRGIFREIQMPFPPHLRQGLIYLRLYNQERERAGLPTVRRIVYIYEFKPTSMVKAFYVARDDEAVQEIWDLCKDIVYALDHGGRPPACRDRRKGICDQCKPYREDKTSDPSGDASSRDAESEPAARGRAREGRARSASAAEGQPARPVRRGSVGSVRPRPDQEDDSVRPVGGLLGRAARRSGGG
jgi:hypothetical protein